MLIILLFLLIIIIFLLKYNNIKNDNIIYIKNFLSKDEYNVILNNINNDKRKLNNQYFRLVKFLNYKNNNIIYDIFYSEKYIKKIQNYVNPQIFKSDYPIEYRIYPINSKGMNIHKDILLYDKPQYECVYTLKNSSDSYTNYIDDDGNINSIWTEPNSILIIKADSNYHSVSKLNKGKRDILKLIYSQSHIINKNYLDAIKDIK
tara:strand:+ start:814 stop:1425 length:612 start_codon:yes stop_codon:yes gene_type:complete